MSYCNKTWYIATLCGNPRWDCFWTHWGQGHCYQKKKMRYCNQVYMKAWVGIALDPLGSRSHWLKYKNGFRMITTVKLYQFFQSPPIPAIFSWVDCHCHVLETVVTFLSSPDQVKFALWDIFTVDHQSNR
jgi:hypothetical protein